MTQRIEPIFYKTQRIELFDMTQRIELFFWILLTELNPFLKYDSKKWKWLEGLTFFFQSDLKNCTLLKMLTQRNVTLFSNMTQRVEPFFEYDTKNWTSILMNFTFDSKELNLSFYHMTQRIDFFGHDSKIELFLTYDSKNWTFFPKMTHGNGKNSKNTTQKYDSKNWTFFNMAQRIELLLFLNTTQRFEYFFCFEYASPFFFEHDSQNWTFFEYDSKNWLF